MSRTRSDRTSLIARISLVAITSALLLTGCREQKKQVSSTPDNGFVEVKEIQGSENYDSLLTAILSIQDRLIAQSKKKELMQEMLSASFQKSSGCFLTAGKGIYNNKLPESIRESERQKAAFLTAQRWAFYLKKWNEGNMIPFGTPVSGTVSYSTNLLKKTSKDTLILLVQIPLGSIYE
ncbi:MAG: hypothetical protein GX556_07745 [Fibrobacter sp.]|nr:hypothetical protein [Fibrobacter sp.]